MDSLYWETETIQSSVMDSMNFEQPVLTCSVNIPDIVHKIMDTPNIEVVLGSFGVRLQSFLKAIDLSHPDVPVIFSQIFSDDLMFYRDVRELIELADYARERSIKVLSKVAGKILRQGYIPKTVLDSIDSPSNNLHRIRLLKTQDERNLARAQKDMQVVNLNIITKKGDEIWNSQPDNFRSYLRFNRPYEEEIKQAEEKAARYERFGLKELTQRVLNSIFEFKNQLQEMYYGFNRLTITNASVILAKFLGCKLITSWSSNFNELRSYRISVPKDIFGSYSFETTPTGDAFDYEPRVYPLDMLWDIVPISVKQIVDHLENFPDAGGKSIFDNYIVLTPSPLYPRFGLDGKFGFRDSTRTDVLFNTRELAMEALDRVLINKCYIFPILLGEKDGKCFFISFWK